NICCRVGVWQQSRLTLGQKFHPLGGCVSHCVAMHTRCVCYKNNINEVRRQLWEPTKKPCSGEVCWHPVFLRACWRRLMYRLKTVICLKRWSLLVFMHGNKLRLTPRAMLCL